MLALPHGAAETGPTRCRRRLDARSTDATAGTAPDASPRRSAPCPARRRRAECRTSCADSGGRHRRRCRPGGKARPARSCSRRPCRPGRRARARSRRSRGWSSSKTPCVDGYVTISAARSSLCCVGLRAQIGDVDVAIFRRRDRHDLEARHHRARRIGAVRGLRNEADLAMRLRRATRDSRGSRAARRIRPASRHSAAATRAANPVISASQSRAARTCRGSRSSATRGANGCSFANSGHETGNISAVAFSFIVQEPSGIIECVSERSRDSSRRR